MTVTVTVPEEYVGDVIGDLNSRRGRPLGMEPKGSVTEIKAEVPMAEMLDYAPDLRAITGRPGRVLDGPRPVRGGARPCGATGGATGSAGKRGREGLIYPGGREEGAPARPRRSQLRRLRANHPEGRARRVVSRAWRPPPPGLRPLRLARPAPRLDPRIRSRRHARPHAAQRAAPGRARPAPQAAAGRGERVAARRAGGDVRRCERHRRGRASAEEVDAPAPPPQRARTRPQSPRHVRAVPDDRRGQGGARSRALQRLGPPAHRGRPRTHARAALGERDARSEPGQRRVRPRRMGAFLVSLPRGPGRRG